MVEYTVIGSGSFQTLGAQVWRSAKRCLSEGTTSILMLFAPGAPREHYFEGMARLGDMTDEERREWFIANDNFFIE